MRRLKLQKQSPLADAIVEGRPYRTVRDVARIQGMTQEILYGRQRLTRAPSPPLSGSKAQPTDET